MKRARAVSILRKYTAAVVLYDQRGAGDPAEIELKELRFKLEREKLIQQLMRVEE